MNQQYRKLDILFVSERAIWPLDQGFRINTCHTVSALADQGIETAVATMAPATGDEPEHIRKLLLSWPTANPNQVQTFESSFSGKLGSLRRRLAKYLSPDFSQVAGLLELIDRHQPRVVVGVGQHAPIWLRALSIDRKLTTVWFALDELVYFHWSCLKHEPLKHWPRRLFNLAIHGLMENLFARNLDAAVGVNPTDTRLLKLIAGVKNTVTIRNGVDIDYYSPPPTGHFETLQSMVFWGRMDFEPNIDAVCWFASNIWPRLRFKHPNARLNILGMNPTAEVKKLNSVPGISVLGPVNDIRPFAARADVVIMPMRCGGGIKNKLLEAAAMGRPIVATPHAVKGLVFPKWSKPVAICHHPAQWVDTISRLWQDTVYSNHLSTTARQWVQSHHTWPNAAAMMTAWLNTMLDEPLTSAADNLDKNHATAA